MAGWLASELRLRPTVCTLRVHVFQVGPDFERTLRGVLARAGLRALLSPEGLVQRPLHVRARRLQDLPPG